MQRQLLLSIWLLILFISAACTSQPEEIKKPSPTAVDPRTAVDVYYAAFNSGDLEELRAILAEELTVSFDFLGQASTFSD